MLADRSRQIVEGSKVRKAKLDARRISALLHVPASPKAVNHRLSRSDTNERRSGSST